MGIYNNTVNKIWSGFSRCRLQLDFVSLFLWGILANFTARQAVANVCTLHSIFSFTRQSSLFSSTRRRLRVLSHHHVALLAWISGSRQWLEIVMATFPPPPNKLASWLSPSARLTVGAGADHSSFTHKARSTKHSLASAWRACTLSGCKCWLGNPADDAVGIHIATPPLPLGGWTNFTSTSILNRLSGWLCSSRGCPLLGAGWPQWTDIW